MAFSYRPITPAGSAVQAAADARARAAAQKAMAAGIAPGAAPVDLRSMAAGIAAGQGEAAVQGAQRGVEAAQKESALGLQGIQQRGSEAIADRRLRLKQRQIEADRSLADLGIQVQRQAFDDKMQFQTDETGRAAFNASQLGDWAIASAKSKEEFLGHMQDMELAHERRMKLLATAQDRINQTLKMEAEGRIAALDRDSKEKLVRAKADLEKKMAQEQADAANRLAAVGAIGTIAGAGVGLLVTGGNPAGAAVGASMGGGAATSLYTAGESSGAFE